jgi:hypothetical protein
MYSDNKWSFIILALHLLKSECPTWICEFIEIHSLLHSSNTNLVNTYLRVVATIRLATTSFIDCIIKTESISFLIDLLNSSEISAWEYLNLIRDQYCYHQRSRQVLNYIYFLSTTLYYLYINLLLLLFLLHLVDQMNSIINIIYIIIFTFFLSLELIVISYGYT